MALWRRRSRLVVALYGADAYGGRAGYAVVLATGGALVTTQRDIGTATG